MFNLDSLTEVQLSRTYSRLYVRAERQFSGGTRYGIDWPTLRVCCPGIYSAMRQIVTAMQLRRM